MLRDIPSQTSKYSDGGDAGDNKNGQPLTSTDYVPAAILNT